MSTTPEPDADAAAEPMATYYDLLARTHQLLDPELYLEIGVHEGHSLAFVGPRTRTIGVDPEPKVADASEATTIVAATSDDFFANPHLGSVLEAPINFAFIDGLHHFDQTLRDFINVERWMATDGVVYIHDCHPIDEVTSARERTTLIWSGDVWRTIVALRRYRPDLNVSTCTVEPTGMGIITGLDPTSTVLDDRFDEIVTEMAALTYVDLDQNRHDMLGTLAPDWVQLRPMLMNRFPKRASSRAKGTQK